MMEMKRWNREEIQKTELVISVHGTKPTHTDAKSVLCRRNPGAQRRGPASWLPHHGELYSSTGSWWHTIRVCILKVACELLANFPSFFWGMGIGGVNRIWHKQTKDAFWSRHSLGFAVECTSYLPGPWFPKRENEHWPSCCQESSRSLKSSASFCILTQLTSVSRIRQGHVGTQDSTSGAPSGSCQPCDAV